MSVARKVIAVTFAFFMVALPAGAQDLTQRPENKAIPIAPAKVPNTNTNYQELRNITLSGEAVSMNNVTLKRDVASFTFKSGNLYFLKLVNGKVTGAVFVGDGSVAIHPVQWYEQRQLSILTKESGADEHFSAAVLRFTDSSYDELKKAGSAAGGGSSGGGDLEDIKNSLRHQLHYNLDGRILEDVLSTEPGGLFVAFIKGKKYSDKEIFAIDPHGAIGFMPAPSWAYYRIKGFLPDRSGPEEVTFLTWEEAKWGSWFSSHLQSEITAGKASGTQVDREIDLVRQKLDTTIEKSGKVDGDATSTFTAIGNGLRVAPFKLYHKLRVKSVTGENGEALDFIQEPVDEDWGFYVVLPKTLNAGETYSIRTVYAGSDTVTNEGGGNYYPVSRDAWYPNTEFSDYAEYDLTFRIPKHMKMVATGKVLHEGDEGDHNVSNWKSEMPQAVAGFSMGKFKREEAKVGSTMTVQSYANEELPDFVKQFQNSLDADNIPRQGAERLLMNQPHTTLDNLSTTAMLKRTLAEGQNAVQLYTAYFGPVSYSNVSLTQQTACNYGQAWPGLVYLPICAFWDKTIQNQLGLTFGDRGYWSVVTPHEVAHQWWGHTVGFNSYRDQWMSEGFAEMSASLFLQQVYGMARFQKFWDDELWILTRKNNFGYGPVDAGPVTMGYRLDTSKTGSVYSSLIYPKGGYILHMVRMMMWNPQNPDAEFKAMMQDFVKTYANRPASTEDFKAMVEKHMTGQMDLDRNKRMDWFFDQYVYGIGIPTYRFEQSIQAGGNGPVLSFKLTQSGVDPNFKMLVPLYIELANGNIIRLGSATIKGNSTVQQSIPLAGLGLKDPPKRALINYMYDVLSYTDK